MPLDIGIKGLCKCGSDFITAEKVFRMHFQSEPSQARKSSGKQKDDSNAFATSKRQMWQLVKRQNSVSPSLCDAHSFTQSLYVWSVISLSIKLWLLNDYTFFTVGLALEMILFWVATVVITLVRFHPFWNEKIWLLSCWECFNIIRM